MRWLWYERSGRAGQSGDSRRAERKTERKARRQRGSSHIRPRVATAGQAAWLAQQGGMTAASATDTGMAPLATQATARNASGATLGSATADLRAATFAYFAPVTATVAPVAPQWRAVARETTEWAPAPPVPPAPQTTQPQARRLSAGTEERSVTATLIRATALVAQVLGRAPEDVWAEALENWLASQDQSQQYPQQGYEGEQPVYGAPAPRARLVEVRRHEAWQTIDETLHALRVS